MNIDLESIAEENLRKYGTDIDRYGPVLLAHLYSDRTHFIFELLQNAEDAGASEVEFSLFKDRLEVRHNGRAFNSDDVRGICGLVEGTKSEDYTKIGRFGIGFKSVYAYTRSPEVHSEGHHFCISNYVIPQSIESITVDEDMTLFVFPFDHGEVQACESYEEIKERLSSLSLRTLLFLKSIEVVRWSDCEVPQGEYRRKIRNRKLGLSVTLESKSPSERMRERWIVFCRPLPPSDGASQPDPALQVEIAYRVCENDSGSDQIMPVIESPLIVFFETEKETNLGFLAQGPYVTTPARDNVPERQGWNIALVSETAKLVAESLHHLKDMGLLSVSALNCMPLDPLDFQEGSMFRPVYESVRRVLADEELLPARGGGHTSAKRAVLARGADMVKLFNPRRLQKLLRLDLPPKWLSTEITQNKAPELYNYLTNSPEESTTDKDETFRIPEVRPETIMHHLTAQFMKGQSEAWDKQLYLYFATKQDLHSALKELPILRTSRGSFVAAVNENGLPLVFLPSENSSGYLTLKKSLVQDSALLEFFHSLGIAKPDLTSEVLRDVVPKYSDKSTPSIGIREHRQDIEKIVSSLRSSSDLKDELVLALKGTAFLRGKNAKTGRGAFMRPTELYRASQEHTLYFEGNESIWFLSESPEFEAMFIELGIKKSVEATCRRPGIDGHVQVIAENRNHRRGLDGYDPECNIDGLAHALRSPTIEKSRFIWNELLVPHSRSIRGKVQSAQWHTYKHAIEEDSYSPMGDLVSNSRWLCNENSEYVRPEDLCADELPDDYIQSEEVVKSLGMRPASISALAQEAGISLQLLDEIRKAPSIFEEFLSWKRESEEDENDDKLTQEPLAEHGVPSTVDEMWDPGRENRKPIEEEDLDSSAQAGTDLEENEPKKTFVSLLTEALNRPLSRSFRTDDEDSEYYTGGGTVKHPERRAKKLLDRHMDNLANEPSLDARRKKVERTIMEPTNSEVRSTLYEWYGGRCQICQQTWTERTGKYFFVSAYLVERKHARAYDDVANAICLCAEHFAQWRLAPCEAPDIIEQIEDMKLESEGGDSNLSIQFRMLGKSLKVVYCEQHFLALRELIKASIV